MGEINCCCCIPIRAGVITLAILGLIGGGYNILRGILAFLTDPDNDPTVIQLRQNPETAELADDYAKAAIPLGIYYILNGLFALLMSIILLKGVYDKNVRHLKIWVKVSYVLLGISAVLVICISVAYIILLPGAGVLLGIMTLLIGAIALGISAYYIGVVNKYARIVEEELNQDRVREKV